MTTVYFSGGDSAEVVDVQGDNPKTFTIPAASIDAFVKAYLAQKTARFSEGGAEYYLKSMNGNQGVAVRNR